MLQVPRLLAEAARSVDPAFREMRSLESLANL